MRFPGDGSVNLQHFLLAWQQEIWWTWAGQMSSQVDRDRYWEVVSHALRKYFNEDKLVRKIKIWYFYTACSKNGILL